VIMLQDEAGNYLFDELGNFLFPEDYVPVTIYPGGPAWEWKRRQDEDDEVLLWMVEKSMF